MNILFVFSLLLCTNLHPINIGMDSEAQEDLCTMLISLNLASQEFLYKDHIIVTPDHPGIGIKSLQVNVPLESVYDPATKKTQSIYQGNVVLKVEIEKKGSGPVNDAHIRFGYHTNQLSSPHDLFIPVRFKPASGENPQPINTSTKRMIPQSIQPETKKPFSFSKYVSNWIKESDSLPLRMLLILLLGALLSLTPCIYPMIPITVSILKEQSSNSFLRNFLIALSYTCGISLTYAIFGLLVSSLGPIWGSLLTNPIFVLPLVALLVYCALSMFDLYDLYIPRFMMRSNGPTKYNNSLLSAFVFGAVSGTIASPCVSPGLTLVLSIAATIGNLFIGFALLFAFGIGLSLPLLIIGTFSTSASMFPKAGMWMIEVKKLLGLVLLGLCFYYLQNIMPWMYVLMLAALFCCVAGTYWLHHALTVKSNVWKNINNLIGILLLGGSVLLAVESAQIFFEPQKYTDSISDTATSPSGFAWKTDYAQARAEAIRSNKLLFLDFWATWCSICMKINNTVFKDHNILNALAASYVSVSVDASTSTNEPYAHLRTQYKITGFPTFLIVDPVTEKVIKELSSEVFSMPRASFISKLEKYAQR